MTQDKMASRPTGTVAFSISLAKVGTSVIQNNKEFRVINGY